MLVTPWQTSKRVTHIGVDSDHLKFAQGRSQFVVLSEQEILFQSRLVAGLRSRSKWRVQGLHTRYSGTKGLLQVSPTQLAGVFPRQSAKNAISALGGLQVNMHSILYVFHCFTKSATVFLVDTLCVFNIHGEHIEKMFEFPAKHVNYMCVFQGIDGFSAKNQCGFWEGPLDLEQEI